MVVSKNAVLIELDKSLFNSDEDDFGLLKIYQNLDQESVELLQEMQTYINLIGFYNVEHKFHSILEDRLKKADLNFAQLITAPDECYLKVKSNAYNTFSGKYSISCYIDEKENSPWHAHPKISRLRIH